MTGDFWEICLVRSSRQYQTHCREAVTRELPHLAHSRIRPIAACRPAVGNDRNVAMGVI